MVTLRAGYEGLRNNIHWVNTPNRPVQFSAVQRQVAGVLESDREVQMMLNHRVPANGPLYFLCDEIAAETVLPRETDVFNSLVLYNLYPKLSEEFSLICSTPDFPGEGYLILFGHRWPAFDAAKARGVLRHEAGHIAAGALPEPFKFRAYDKYTEDNDPEILHNLNNMIDDFVAVDFQLNHGLEGSADDYCRHVIDGTRQNPELESLRRYGQDSYLTTYFYIINYSKGLLAFEKASHPDLPKKKAEYDSAFRGLMTGQGLEIAHGIIQEHFMQSVFKGAGISALEYHGLVEALREFGNG